MLRVTNIRSDDPEGLAELERFLNDNADPGVRPRPAEQLKLAVEGGLALIVREGDDIGGVSLIHQFTGDSPERFFSEIGTMRITANGYGLQVLLARLHLAQIYLQEFYAVMHQVFAVVSHGTASEHNLVDLCGLTDWTPPDDLQRSRADKGLPFNPEKRTLQASEAAFSDARVQLDAARVDANVYRLPKGDARIAFDLGWLPAGGFLSGE